MNQFFGLQALVGLIELEQEDGGMGLALRQNVLVFFRRLRR